jgi:hypothetical protein
MGKRGWTMAMVGLCLVACSSKDAGTPSQDAGAGSSKGDSGDVIVASDDAGADAMRPPAQTTTQTVGAAGGVVSAAGVVVTIPSGALGSDTAITVTTSDAQIPAGYTGLSAIFSFGPAGTVLLKPAVVAIGLKTQVLDAKIFWSNAGGGYDELPTTVTADSASASITRLDEGFAGERQADDAGAAPSEAGPVAEGGINEDASASDGAVHDAGSPAEGGVVDAAAASLEAGAYGIAVTIDGVPTTFSYNTRAIPLQAWWGIAADDNPSPTHWTMEVVTPTNAQTISCSGIYPEITYTHYTAVSADAGALDATFTTNTVGGNCSIDEATTATVQGQHAQGTFSGKLALQGDAGAASHTLASGSYDMVVP